MNKTLILAIKGNSLDDGPGIRTVVFFKGCPLNCVWCHNPESKRAVVELSWDQNECIGCLTCTTVCHVNAISKNNTFFINRDTCTLCFQCVEVCPSGAMAGVGKYMDVNGVVNEIIKDKPFFDTSGGGVTLSGGEPTVYMQFASELLKALKKIKIHTLIETGGYFNWDEFEANIAPYCDMVYYDIKLIDDDEHKKYCGVSNAKILQNFKNLVELSQKNTIQLMPRIPLVPEITATKHNIEGIAQFLSECGVNHVQLLRYNPLWPEKCKKIGISPELIDKKLTQWMSAEEYEQCRQVACKNGMQM